MLPIRHYDSDGDILVRDGLILAFFLKQPFHKMAPGIRHAFDAWLALIPEGNLKWAMIGANAEIHKPFNSRTLKRCFDQLDPQKARKRNISSFDIQGKDKYNAGFCFSTVGSNDIHEDSARSATNLLEIRIPTEFFQELGPDGFIRFGLTISEFLAYDSGYASLALNFGYESAAWEAGKLIAPLALRHPGFDINNNQYSRFVLDRSCRGARWITFLGPHLTERIGGKQSLKKKIDPGAEIMQAGNGIAIRAGAEPEIGDLNRKQDLPLLKSVAAAIEGISYFNDSSLKVLFNEDEDKLEKWERRFLD
ncbi:MAG: DUF3396 domain-containing protein [Desulfobacteraceae bacterium]|nr:DUF3396 domain-containing protein [Desulfobacteraceae bacterium]